MTYDEANIFRGKLGSMGFLMLLVVTAVVGDNSDNIDKIRYIQQVPIYQKNRQSPIFFQNGEPDL